MAEKEPVKKGRQYWDLEISDLLNKFNRLYCDGKKLEAYELLKDVSKEAFELKEGEKGALEHGAVKGRSERVVDPGERCGYDRFDDF